MKIKRRGEVLIELDADEAEELRRFLYNVDVEVEYYYYSTLLRDMYEKLADV